MNGFQFQRVFWVQFLISSISFKSDGQNYLLLESCCARDFTKTCLSHSLSSFVSSSKFRSYQRNGYHFNKMKIYGISVYLKNHNTLLL